MTFQTPFFSPDSASALIYRRFNRENDIAALVTLLSEVERVDQDGGDVSETILREQLTWPGQDRWVAQADSSALWGHAAIFKTPNDEHADLGIAVHPARRRQGVGSALLRYLMERAREVQAQDIRVYAGAQNKAAHAFLHKHGFEPVATYTRLAALGVPPFPQPDLPTGFFVRSYAQMPQIDLFTNAMNQSYAGLWGHRHSSQEEVEAWFPQLSPEGIFFLCAPDGSVAGLGRAEISEHLTTQRGVPTGLIDAPGIVPAYRNAGLYLPLFLTLLQWLLQQNPTAIELESWGDAPATLDLYRSLGFTPVTEAISYRRSLV